MVVCGFFFFFFTLAIALKMQYGYWQLKILWLTFLAHGVGIKINGIFCYFPSFNHTFFFFFFCLPHTNHTCFISSNVAEKKSPTCISLWNRRQLWRGNSLMLLHGWSKISHLDKGKKKGRAGQLSYKSLTPPKKKEKNYWFLFPHGFRQQAMSGFPIGSITHKSECVHFSLMD